jgi:hypothetical protein
VEVHTSVAAVEVVDRSSEGEGAVVRAEAKVPSSEAAEVVRMRRKVKEVAHKEAVLESADSLTL